VPKVVNDALERLQGLSMGMRVSELLLATVSELQKVLADGPSNNLPQHYDSDDEMAIDSDDEGSEFDWPQSPIHDSDGNPMSGDAAFVSIRPEVAAALNKRIKEDLRAVRNAGFRVGILDGMTAEARDCLLSVSIRVSQLGLSEEAVQAWDLQKNQYIVLLLQYSAGYKTFQAIISEPARNNEIGFRIGVSNRYKPTTADAKAAFSTVLRPESNSTPDGSALDDDRNLNNSTLQAGFQSLFISSSLNKFINDQFTSLVKIRRAQGFDWDGAKLYYGANQGRAGTNSPLQTLPITCEPRPTQAPLPTVVTADHMLDAQGDSLSFPLIAMQFVMRYLTRCTEFCLVCHDRTEDMFEALKPYVCSKPLCLYQCKFP
jgi:ubiquitin-conjugating enzyme E2 Q